MRHCGILVCVLYGLFLAYRPPVTAAETGVAELQAETRQLGGKWTARAPPDLGSVTLSFLVQIFGDHRSCRLPAFSSWPVFAFMPLWTLSIRYLTARVTYTRLSRARLTSYESPSGIKTIGVLTRCIETMFAPSMILYQFIMRIDSIITHLPKLRFPIVWSYLKKTSVSAGVDVRRQGQPLSRLRFGLKGP
ncbi:hypothetical protein D6C78_05716 [Aureobasidium pullulans]|uniref:Uncharacterized protein n=1 Tax=Aureobasidium pullulans TaxID=5580 RepID=A0A4T0BPN4_AURPU|nr:hypothetical protein D6C78_05716 [Aureobasidium pullulans]